jgi:very-short-patch-repair endonuclease
LKVALTSTARKLRRETTDAESRLWRALCNRQMYGFKFKRQAAFGPYIVDFICIEAKLIVEADGGQHSENEEADGVRSQYFERLGCRVLRFWNHEVLEIFDGVLEAIAAALGPEDPLTPTLSPGGEGASCGLSPKGEDNSGVPSPLGEKDRACTREGG